MTSEIVKIHVLLLNEGSPTVKRAEATSLGNGKYKILKPKDYDPEDEEWEFTPGTIVHCKKVEKGWREPLFLAVSKVE